MGRTVFVFCLKSPASDLSTMIPAVVLAVVLMVPTFSLPLESVGSGFDGTQAIQGGAGVIPETVTTGEKTGIQGISQIGTGISEGTKTGAEGVPAGVIQNVQAFERPVYQQVEQAFQPAVNQVYTGAPAQYSKPVTEQQVEKTGIQTPSEGYTSQQYPESYPQNTAVPKGENVPVEHKQPVQTPLLLPIQPLTVVPVNQVGEVLRPVVVPEEAVTAGRVIIMAIEPIQQRNIPEATPEKQVPFQQGVQPVLPQGVQQTNQQPLFVQTVQKQDPLSQTYIPVQVQPEQTTVVREQALYNPTFPQQSAEQVQPYNPAEHRPQIYNVQPSQVVNEYVEKQAPQQTVGYTPGQTQYVEGTQQGQIAQQTLEKQGQYQQVSEYTPVQSQGVQSLYQQQVNPVPVENVQQYQQVEQQQQVFNAQQPTQRQTPYQQSSEFIPVQNQEGYVRPEQQVYNVRPEYQQTFEQVQSHPTQQQVYNVQPEHHQSYTPVEQTQNVQQTYEKKVPYQQTTQTAQDIQPHQQQLTYQQQVSSVQPFAATQVETQAPIQSVQQETYVPQQLQKTTELQQPQQVFGAEPQPNVNYNFGDRIPQVPSVQQSTLTHVLPAAAQTPVQSVNPPVVPSQA